MPKRLQNWTNFWFNHRILALVLTFVVTFIPLVGVIGIVFAALVTLRKGIVEGAIFTLITTLPYSFLHMVMPGNESFSPMLIWVAVGIGAVSNVLTWAFAAMMNRKADWSTVLQTTALFGVLVVSVVHLVYPEVANWWFNQLQTVDEPVHQAITATLTSKAEIEGAHEMQMQLINSAKLVASGTVVGFTLLMGIWQLVLACWWNAIAFQPGSLRKGLHGIRLSPLAGALFLISLVFSYLGNSVVLDIMPILYLLFCGAGLSVLHYLFGMMKSPVVWFWLLLMYVILGITMPVSIVAVSTVALLDIWLDLRKRFKKAI